MKWKPCNFSEVLSWYIGTSASWLLALVPREAYCAGSDSADYVYATN
jgi:hypothetical protein